MHLYIFTMIALLAAMLAPGATRQGVAVPNRIIAVICFFWLFLLASVRIDTGTDFQNYRDIWTYAPALNDLTLGHIFFGYLEPLFVATNSVLKGVSQQELLFYSVYAALTLYGVSRAIAHYRINQIYACFVYFCVFYLPYTFNVMRQALAMSLFLLALSSIIRRKTLNVWLIGLIATGFHFSGILIIMSFYYLKAVDYLRLQPKTLLVWGGTISLGIGVSGLGGMLYFGLFSAKMETYAELFSEGTSLVNAAIRIMFAALLIYNGTRGKRDAALESILNIYLLGLFLYLSLLSFNMLGTRFNMFVRVLEVILIPAVFARLHGANRLIFFGLTTVFLLIGFFSVALHPDYSYQTIFD